MHINFRKLFLTSNQLFKTLLQAVLQISVPFLFPTLSSFYESGVLYTRTVFLCCSNLVRIFSCVLFSGGCLNNLPHTGRPKNNRNIFSHRAEGRKSELKVLAGCAPNRGLQGRILPGPSELLAAPGVLRLVTASPSPCLCLSSAFSPLCLSLQSLSAFPS